MDQFPDTAGLMSLERPHYLPPAPRAVESNTRLLVLRLSLLAGLFIAVPVIWQLGQAGGEQLERLAQYGHSTRATLVPRG